MKRKVKQFHPFPLFPIDKRSMNSIYCCQSLTLHLFCHLQHYHISWSDPYLLAIGKNYPHNTRLLLCCPFLKSKTGRKIIISNDLVSNAFFFQNFDGDDANIFCEFSSSLGQILEEQAATARTLKY